MSLKAFHVLFVTLSTLLAVGFGLWSAERFLEAGGAAPLAWAVAGFAAAASLVTYGLWFLRKLRGVSYL